MIADENSSHFIACPSEQESGADGRAVESHPPKASAFHGALFRQTMPIILGVVRNPTKKK
jgi:hypothetical protein